MPDDLLRHGHRPSEAVLEARLRTRLDGVDDPSAALRVIAHELLPLDAERTSAIRVASAFGARALHEPSLGEEVGARPRPALRCGQPHPPSPAGRTDPGAART